MKVHASALKNVVSADDAVQAASWALWVEQLADKEWPPRELRQDTGAAHPHAD